MTAVQSTPRTAPVSAPPPPSQVPEASGLLRRGQSGQEVTALQQQLQAQGYDIQADGRFGPETAAAVRRFQADHGCRVDGIVGPETRAALRGAPPRSSVEAQSQTARRHNGQRSVGNDPTPRAPTEQQTRDAQQRPGTVRAGDLIPPGQMNRPTGVEPTQGAQPSGPADARLLRMQQASVDSARRELAAGVREDGNTNRSERVDHYARTAGMSPGGEWCGYFTGFNYTQAARDNGMEFSGRTRMHSVEKARSYFVYSNYTNNSRAERDRNSALRTQHEADGSSRRWMTLSGSDGDRWATRNGHPHETFQSPSDLPVRGGDTVLFRGHIGMVESYDPQSGRLVTIEGNTTGGRVRRREYDLNDPAVRARIEGFGRPAAGDFQPRRAD